MEKELCNTCSVLTINVARMEEKFDNIEKKLDSHIQDQKDDFSKLTGAIHEWMENADRKYSSKWVEKILIWGGSILGAAGLIAIFKFFVTIARTH